VLGYDYSVGILSHISSPATIPPHILSPSLVGVSIGRSRHSILPSKLLHCAVPARLIGRPGFSRHPTSPPSTYSEEPRLADMQPGHPNRSRREGKRQLSLFQQKAYSLLPLKSTSPATCPIGRHLGETPLLYLTSPYHSPIGGEGLELPRGSIC